MSPKPDGEPKTAYMVFRPRVRGSVAPGRKSTVATPDQDAAAKAKEVDDLDAPAEG